MKCIDIFKTTLLKSEKTIFLIITETFKFQ